MGWHGACTYLAAAPTSSNKLEHFHTSIFAPIVPHTGGLDNTGIGSHSLLVRWVSDLEWGQGNQRKVWNQIKFTQN